jgi:hypothetical protein
MFRHGFSLLPKIVVRLSPLGRAEKQARSRHKSGQKSGPFAPSMAAVSSVAMHYERVFFSDFGVVRAARRAYWQGLPLKNNIYQ